MNPDVKKLWIEALRSDKYEQCHERLRDIEEDSYCCLGVLTQLYCDTTGKTWDDLDLHEESAYPPVVVTDWAGLPSFFKLDPQNSNCTVTDPSHRANALWCLNDGQGGKIGSNWPIEYNYYRPHDFFEIADVIEKHF